MPPSHRAGREISIHAPREGGDCCMPAMPALDDHFNPRPPRGGRRNAPTHRHRIDSYFNPRPPRGGRRWTGAVCQGRGGISIHAPREGGDGNAVQAAAASTEFQSTPPARGATCRGAGAVRRTSHFNPRPPRGGRRVSASILKPLLFNFNPRPPRGGRRRRIFQFRRNPYFNPRPPRGGRPIRTVCSCRVIRFQSTPPARGATYSRDMTLQGIVISIHAPREGGDTSNSRSC